MAAPIIKIVGGKRQHAVIEVVQGIAKTRWSDTYIEPFFGGGAVFFALANAGYTQNRTIILGDADSELIAMYAAIRRNPNAVYKSAKAEADLVASYPAVRERKHAYNELRELWNLGSRKPGYDLYLRHACFNGCFRRNRKGEMNMPPRDRLDEVHLPGKGDLLEVARVLEGAELLDWDFRQYERDAFVGPGCLVYLDPPYDGGEGAFREYTAESFTAADQRDLLMLAAEWSRRGAEVVYSNADTPLIRELFAAYWPEALIVPVQARRTVSCDGTGRDPAPEIIAYV